MTRVLSALVVSVVFAQQAVVPSLGGPPANTSSGPVATAPSRAAATVGFQRVSVDSAETAPAPFAEPRVGAGSNIALMVVGGVALAIGLAIGDTAGTIVAVGGGLLGLLGLYRFIQ